jgi:WD40 repeat protein
MADLSPLQLYSSALIFAPKTSIIRNTFQNCIPSWISQQPEVEAGWNAVLQTLEHSSGVNSVAFSHDSKLLASASDDKTVKVWDAATGTLQQTLEGHNSGVYSVAFSHDSKLLASASCDKTVKVWDAATGTLQQTLTVGSYVGSLLFDNTNSILVTNIGYFKLDRTTNLPLSTSSREISSRSHCKGLSISGSWVLWNGQNLLWLPPDFRATTSVISHTGSILAIGCQSGKVFIIGINIPHSNIL